ncbi:MAG TPA: hypothetical protein VH476_03230 [Solirubrobacterales bacterium]
MPVPAAGINDSADQKGSSSNALLLLIVVVLGLIAVNACFRLWRHRRQKQQQTVWRPTEESRWKAVLQQAEMERGHRPSSDGAERRRSDPGSGREILVSAEGQGYRRARSRQRGFQ